MRLFDVNAWLGHYPFRQIPGNTPEALLRTMDQRGIDKAVVSSLHGVFYRDPQPANAELADWIAPFRDRLVPFATLNPTYPGWDDDLRRCREDWGMVGIRLYPAHHRYSLVTSECRALVDAVTADRLPVAIPLRIEDRRQRHWMDTTQDVSLAAVAELSEACPAASLIALEALGVENSRFVRDPALGSARVYFEFSRMATVLQRTIPELIGQIGPDRLLFGTGMPLKYPLAAVMKLELLQVPEEVKQQLAAGNLESLLGPN
jgi:predicted TIM-barrel fold metal-dependent hydrolase